MASLCSLPPEIRHAIRLSLHPIHRIRLSRLCHLLHDEDHVPGVDPTNWCLRIFGTPPATREERLVVRELIYSGLYAHERPNDCYLTRFKAGGVTLCWPLLMVELWVSPDGIEKSMFDAHSCGSAVIPLNRSVHYTFDGNKFVAAHSNPIHPLDSNHPPVHARVTLRSFVLFIYEHLQVRAERQHISDALSACQLVSKNYEVK